MGNGQYYNPVTGRFLSRGVNPGAPNPYVPWQGDPLGMILGPLALLALIRGKRKAGKFDQFLVVLIVVAAFGLTLTGCNPPPPPQPPTQQPTNPPSTKTPEPKPTSTPTDQPTGTPAPTQTPTATLKPPEKCGPDTEIDNKTEGLGYYGKKIYAFYEGMVKATDAWWYKLNGGDFTWEQFNGLLLMHEGAGIDVMADLLSG